METVNMQRLQLLNDRIAQTIEALNQLRLTVHGISHTSAPVSPWGGYPMTYGQPSFVQPTSFGQSFGQPQFVQQPFVSSPFGYGFGGISHSTFEPTWWQTRQTVPTMQPSMHTTPWLPTYPVSIY